MSSRSPLAITAFCLTLSGVSSMAAPAAELQPVVQLHQLGVVLVRDESLGREIIAAEDGFFARYNQLNGNRDFDIVCGRATSNGGLVHRQCRARHPEDLGEIPAYSSGTGAASPGGGNPAAEYYTMDPQFPSVRPTMRRDAYTKNVLKVINGDAQLLDQYYRLLGLYQQMDAIQQRYAVAREQNFANRTSTAPVPGPRYH